MSAARLCLAAVVAAGACAVLAGPAAASSGPSVKMYDDCDPASFNAAIGPGACVGDGRTPFGDFIAALASPAKSHPEWRFEPEARTIGEGRSLDVRNRGGEAHTFTEVPTDLGFQDIGCVPPVNAVLLRLDPAVDEIPVSPICNDPDLGATEFLPDARRAVTPKGPGTHLFQCMIHPWMRITVRVKDD